MSLYCCCIIMVILLSIDWLILCLIASDIWCYMTKPFKFKMTWDAAEKVWEMRIACIGPNILQLYSVVQLLNIYDVHHTIYMYIINIWLHLDSQSYPGDPESHTVYLRIRIGPFFSRVCIRIIVSKNLSLYAYSAVAFYVWLQPYTIHE